MNTDEIRAAVDQKFPGKITPSEAEATGGPWIEVGPDALVDVMTFLKSEKDLEFDELMCLSGVDYGPEKEFGVTYHLCSTRLGHKFTVKVKVPREAPVVPSVAALWRTANWHEREAFDMYGITFQGHPDLTRILLPDDWEGYPLRKDYVLVKTYHGVRFKD